MTDFNEDKLIRVDMTKLTVTVEPFPVGWKLLGGRSLSARILSNECNPESDPVDADNLLIIAPGVLSGTSAPTSGRTSVGCKSPLTGGVKEANAGGNPGQDLMKLGYRAIVIKGQPADRNKRYGLEVNQEQVQLVDAVDYQGMWNYECAEKLLKNYPATTSAITVGPAGEMMLKGACINLTDKDKGGRPTRTAARGGVGAVMGSKCLKWITIDPGRLTVRQAVKSKEFAMLKRTFSREYLDTRHDFYKYGTSAGVPYANMLNTFPYKNWRHGQNPKYEGLDGNAIRETFATRGGKMENCMNGCIIRCSNVVHDNNANYLTSGFEYQSIACLGSNCGINDWEKVAELDRLCDELGLDTIEVGNAVAVLMDAGDIDWGDDAAVKRLFTEEIGKGTDLGRLVGDGPLAVGQMKKHDRIPVVHGQAIPAWDPRVMHVAGVTYATSAMGADHTAGLVIDPEITGDKAVQASQENQLINAIVDSSGFCQFLEPTLDEICQFYSCLYGEDVTQDEILNIGWECLENEWDFNRSASMWDDDDDVPAWIREESLGNNDKYKFDIPKEALSAAKRRGTVRNKIFTKRSTV